MEIPMREVAYPPDPFSIDWRIARDAIDWADVTGGYQARYERSPQKIELIHGKLFMGEEQRLIMVGLLLENLGLDKVMQLGDPRVWKEAAAALPHSHAQP
jgi:hypothetical protein